MGRVDEEHVTFTGLGGGQDRLQFGVEKSGLVCNVLGQGFFWRHGDRTDPVKLQAQILEELVRHPAGPAAQPGQLKDAFARLGDGRGWLLLEGGADQLAIGGHLAHRATEIPLPQAVQAPLPKRGHVSLDGGPTDSDSLGRMLTREPGVQQPKHEHLFANSEVGMTAPFLVDDALLFLGQPHAKPGHGVPPCVTSQSG